MNIFLFGTMIDDLSYLFRYFMVIRGDHPSFAGGHILRGIKGKAARAKRAHFPALKLRAMSLAGVFDDY